MRQNGDQRVLPQKRALARHVGAGDEPDPVVRQNAVIGDEGPAPALAGQRRLDGRMTPAADLEGGALVDCRPHPQRLGRELGQRRREVECGERRRGGGDLGAAGHHLTDEILVEPQFQRQSPLGGTGDLGFEVGQFGRRVALRARHRLAVDKFRPELAGMVRRHLDVITDDVVVADLQCADRGLAGIARLQCRDHPAALVAQAAPFVELVRISRAR